jgi:hypothetical protein
MTPADGDEASGNTAHPRELASLAASHIGSGKLPRSGGSSVLAGPGRNERCDLCSDTIPASSIAYEVPPPNGRGASLSFHIPCHAAWQQASAKSDTG